MRLALLIFSLLTSTGAATPEKATFAGGCFWCMVSEFRDLPGVTSVISGYTGGDTPKPTYSQVSSGTTGHLEAVQITFDPSKTPYSRLLEIYWENTDPLDAKGQFCDQGEQYLPAIFVHNSAQEKAAEASKLKIADKLHAKGKITTAIRPASTFYPAEDYHQDYDRKNPGRYREYRIGCGRDSRLKQLWKK